MHDSLKQIEKDKIPPLLREIPKPPQRLYVRGELPDIEWKWLAVVGSRALTPYGKQACEYLIESLRGYPVVIVSGLAYGADACAHRAAMRAGLPTVAVPGSGLDWNVMYPRAHVHLAKEIIENGGAHLSEFAPDTHAAPYTFPQRNRIMAGLCHATLLIEAKERSGTLITARLTSEFNRELLVVPGSIFSPTSKGVHQFLKLGATPVTEPEDILRALGIEAETKTARHDDLSDDERRVLTLVATPLSRDELLSALKMPITDAQVLLSTMEIKGLIVEILGRIQAQ